VGVTRRLLVRGSEEDFELDFREGKKIFQAEKVCLKVQKSKGIS
jgi:hypothetical protein